jgi:hypothetical protein
LRRRLHLPVLLSLVLRFKLKVSARNPVKVSVNATKQLVKTLQQHKGRNHSAKRLIKDASPVVNNKDASFFDERAFF